LNVFHELTELSSSSTSSTSASLTLIPLTRSLTTYQLVGWNS